MKNEIGLAQLITDVGRELRVAIDRYNRGDKEITLKVKEVTFEINMVAVEKAGVEGGIDLKIVSLGSNLSDEISHIHKVIVKTEAYGQEDIVVGEVLVSDVDDVR